MRIFFSFWSAHYFLFSFNLLTIISQYFDANSTPIYLRPVCFAAKSVVPEPAKGSNTMLPGFDQVRIGSRASASGKGAGCVSLPFCQCGGKSHILKRCPKSATQKRGFRFMLPSACRCVLCPVFPACLFGLSFIGLKIFGVPFDKTNIYSKTGAYRVFNAPTAEKPDLFHLS